MEIKKFWEKNPDDTPVPREELTALGIPDNVTMTRKELNSRLETKKLQAAQEASGKSPTESLARRMDEELTDEEIRRAQEAGQKREEMGK